MTAHYYFNEKETADWLAKQPRKVIAAKAVLRSESGKVLLVKPNYKHTWQFPGGGIEISEEPVEGLVRELQEELSITVIKNDLQLLDTVFLQNRDTLILIYEYTPKLDEKKSIHYQQSELEDWKYMELREATHLLADYYQDFWLQYIEHHS